MLGMMRLMLALTALNGLMGVAAGAFGAHGVADPQVKAWLQTGAQYQIVHAVAAIACMALMTRMPGWAPWAGWLFGVGGLVFGGSLYLMALTGVRVLGAVTPVGGVLLIAGWAVMLVGALAGMAAQGARP